MGKEIKVVVKSFKTDPRLWKRLKSKVVQNDETIQEVMATMIKQYLKGGAK